MLGNHSILNAEHVEPERLMTLAVFAARPGLPHIDDDHVVVANYI